MTLRQLAEQALSEGSHSFNSARRVTAEMVLALLKDNRRLTGREIAFALGLGRNAKLEALAGGGVYAALSELLQAHKIATDPRDSRFFLKRA